MQAKSFTNKFVITEFKLRTMKNTFHNQPNKCTVMQTQKPNHD